MAQEVAEQMARWVTAGPGDVLVTPGTHKSDVRPQLESTESLLTGGADVSASETTLAAAARIKLNDASPPSQ